MTHPVIEQAFVAAVEAVQPATAQSNARTNQAPHDEPNNRRLDPLDEQRKR